MQYAILNWMLEQNIFPLALRDSSGTTGEMCVSEDQIAVLEQC